MTAPRGRLLCAREIAHDARLRAELVSLLLEAARPYACTLYGDEPTALSVFAAAAASSSCDVSFGRTRVLMDGEALLGCYAAVPGDELPACRRAELIEALRQAGPGGAAALHARLAALGTLLPPVSPDEFYLSKVAVRFEARGCGLGRRLLGDFLEQGRRRGFRRFRLDVAQGNLAARRLYEQSGFRVVEERSSRSGALSYLSMSAADEERAP